jgi:hypothetical protein
MKKEVTLGFKVVICESADFACGSLRKEIKLSFSSNFRKRLAKFAVNRFKWPLIAFNVQ